GGSGRGGVRDAGPQRPADAVPPAVQLEGVRACDQRSLLHLDRGSRSQVRSRRVPALPARAGRGARRGGGVGHAPSAHELELQAITIPEGSGWYRLPWIGLAVSVVGIAASAALSPGAPDRAAYAWIVSFLFFLSIALGALFFVLVLFATKAGWG